MQHKLCGDVQEPSPRSTPAVSLSQADPVVQPSASPVGTIGQASTSQQQKGHASSQQANGSLHHQHGQSAEGALAVHSHLVYCVYGHSTYIVCMYILHDGTSIATRVQIYAIALEKFYCNWRVSTEAQSLAIKQYDMHFKVSGIRDLRHCLIPEVYEFACKALQVQLLQVRLCTQA